MPVSLPAWMHDHPPSLASTQPPGPLLPDPPCAELFSQGSSRLDSGRSGQLDWGNSGAFGEAAWLAAGAPSGSGAAADEEAGGVAPLPSVEQQQQHQGEPAAQGAAGPFHHAPSPFQDVPRRG